MAGTVRYIKYELSKASGKKLLETDFSTDSEIEEEHLLQVTRDLANFSNNIKDPVDYKSTLTVQTSDDVIEIERNYNEGTSKLTSQKQVDPNFFWLPDDIAEYTVSDRNPFVLFPLRESELLAHTARLLPALAKFDVENKQIRSKDEILQELSSLGGNQLEKLDEVDREVEKIESDLQKQRDVDEAQLSISDLQTKQQDIDTTLKGVEDLIQAQKNVYEKLKQYAKVIGPEVVGKAEQIRKHMEELRVKKLKYESEVSYSTNTTQDIEEHGSSKKPKLANFLFILPIILIALSLIGFLATSNLYVLALGIVGGILEALLYLALNAVEPEVVLAKAKELDLGGTSTRNSGQVESLDGVQINEIRNFFVNKAWLVVLKQEFNQLQESISTRLKGQNFAQIQTAKTEIEAELAQVKALIASHEGQDIAPEEYLRLRRKLDMLKVEKSKLESEIETLPNKDKLKELQAELKIASNLPISYAGGAQTTKLSNSFISVVSDKYIAARINNQSQVELFDVSLGKWISSDFDKDHLLAIYSYLSLLKWGDSPSLPVMIVGVMHHLPQSAQKVIYDKINELKQIGQVVVIKPVANAT